MAWSGAVGMLVDCAASKIRSTSCDTASAPPAGNAARAALTRPDHHPRGYWMGARLAALWERPRPRLVELAGGCAFCRRAG